MSRPSLVIVINALDTGGAERTCIELARHLQADYRIEVVALLIGGRAEQDLRSLGVEATVPSPSTSLLGRVRFGWRLAGMLRRKKPDAVLTFLYVADLIGGVLARILVPRCRVFWNVRCNVPARRHVSFATHCASRVNGLLSRIVPTGIVYCSPLAQVQHEAIGFRGRRNYVVENSAAAVPFSFDPRKRTAFRNERLNLRDERADEYVFLFVGRFDPVKRVDQYIEACARLQGRCSRNLVFVLAGRGMERGNPVVAAAVDAAGPGARFELLGHLPDPQAVYSAADCLVVTSESEGSPNVVYEAMATRLPTVIWATVGTEAIEGWGIHRLETRRMEDLVDLMERLATAGAPVVSERLDRQEVAVPSEHPLVTFYKKLLPSAEEPQERCSSSASPGR